MVRDGTGAVIIRGLHAAPPGVPLVPGGDDELGRDGVPDDHLPVQVLERVRLRPRRLPGAPVMVVAAVGVLGVERRSGSSMLRRCPGGRPDRCPPC